MHKHMHPYTHTHIHTHPHARAHTQWKWSKECSLVPALHQCSFPALIMYTEMSSLGKDERWVLSYRTLLLVHLPVTYNHFKKRKKSSHGLKFLRVSFVPMNVFKTWIHSGPFELVLEQLMVPLWLPDVCSRKNGTEVMLTTSDRGERQLTPPPTSAVQWAMSRLPILTYTQCIIAN